ncbi:TraR/DksA family transcriptional regulator [Mesohalobacter halotolerans]|uniref:TraR/DksA family transcriptional regulator n=1 Tax=Mesohalobacter halotolerans TaxID=1883405 RepID=A0A4U5TR76_9FLAO|nr:TraR/DksA C4-type zinc finger protein [Mesohalobacter halotolerans]TKS56737.1 TraR/DksA family transcriptional regulator [Mesohalobacter halotolerans]
MTTTTKQPERYSDAELAEFRVLIEDKIKNAEKQLNIYIDAYKNGSANDTEDTAPTFKSFDDGSSTLSKEANSQLAIRQEKFIRDLKNALVRIENKSYGICRVTGKLIQKERLKLVPHATLSIEAKNRQN